MSFHHLIRPAIIGAGLLFAGALHTSGAMAAGWPEKPVTLIVPSASGGAADLTARTFAQYLGAQTGQTVIVEDRPGAGGIVGTNAAKNAAADGYTFLLSTNSTHSANQFLYKSLPYDAQKDFQQVGMLGTFGTVGVVAPDSPYRTVPELVAYAKQHPGDVFFGYYSSSSQVPSELLKQRAGINITGAAYKNITQIITDLRGKQIGFAFVDYLTAMGQIDGKGLVPIAVTGAQPNAAWPSVPAMATYYPDFVVAGWLGLSAPARTPPEIVAKMNAYMQAAVKDVATANKLRALGLTPESMDVPRFDAFVKEDTERWKEWIRISGIQPQ
ncbi:tripartite tricarboxylate transporter substrate binding protein [Achromobacter seleniivolatilans]|uniref:Tripartite tricarboxylate transporter substrate binding protein n=1 Tax=Achromobacter seleniivolatilans TaxID=3047478 RepID=A0ABY9LV77_9BURK|nr:tripartite tricarboxylate transporter substrate binding protein [Achromobacter sp. R39]WMD18682.1 tripartite tricarboxylate transporter substrate binding protein [Achromobacter sp. R39]